MKFWTGQTISLVGSQFTVLALPLTAVLTLDASAAEMGFLGAAQFTPALLLGLPAGVWLDRHRRRPLLVGAQLASMVALVSIPLAAAMGHLTLAQLYVVAFVAGSATTLFTVAQNAYMPSLVGRSHLVAVNSRLQTSRTFAQLVGPSVAGWMVQLVGAPFAILIDASSFLVGAATASSIRVREPHPRAESRRPRRLEDMREGLGWLWRDPLIRAITMTLVTANFGSYMSSAVFVLLFVGRGGVTPVQLGLIYAVAGLSSLAGGQASGTVIRRAGVGPILVGACAVSCLGSFLSPVAAFTGGAAVLPLLFVGAAMRGSGLMVFNVNQQALRQAVIPNALLGRVQAGLFVIVNAGQVLGALAGGTLGELVGLKWAIMVSAMMMGAAVPLVLASPLRRLRDLPT